MLGLFPCLLVLLKSASSQRCQNNGTWDVHYRMCLCTYRWTGKDCSQWKHHLCYFDDGFEYRGYLSRTAGGMRCAHWSTDHNVGFPLGTNGVGHHNHCRNPGRDPKGLWCYVDGSQFVDYCNATACPDSYKQPLNVTGMGRGKAGNEETVRFLFGPLVSAICGGVVVLFVLIGLAEFLRRRRLHRKPPQSAVGGGRERRENFQEPRAVVTVNIDTGETCRHS